MMIWERGGQLFIYIILINFFIYLFMLCARVKSNSITCIYSFNGDEGGEIDVGLTCGCTLLLCAYLSFSFRASDVHYYTRLCKRRAVDWRERERERRKKYTWRIAGKCRIQGNCARRGRGATRAWKDMAMAAGEVARIGLYLGIEEIGMLTSNVASARDVEVGARVVKMMPRRVEYWRSKIRSPPTIIGAKTKPRFGGEGRNATKGGVPPSRYTIW